MANPCPNDVAAPCDFSCLTGEQLISCPPYYSLGRTSRKVRFAENSAKSLEKAWQQVSVAQELHQKLIYVHAGIYGNASPEVVVEFGLFE